MIDVVPVVELEGWSFSERALPEHGDFDAWRHFDRCLEAARQSLERFATRMADALPTEVAPPLRVPIARLLAGL